MPWNIAQARQQFSEVVRRCTKRPQLIYNRNNLVAATIDATEYQAFKAWSDKAEKRTLADEFAELREIMEEEDYQLTPAPRSTRKNTVADVLAEEAHDLPG